MSLYDFSNSHKKSQVWVHIEIYLWFMSPLAKPPSVSNPHWLSQALLHHLFQLPLALSSVNSPLAIYFLFLAAYCHALCHVMIITSTVFDQTFDFNQ